MKKKSVYLNIFSVKIHLIHSSYIIMQFVNVNRFIFFLLTDKMAFSVDFLMDNKTCQKGKHTYS